MVLENHGKSCHLALPRSEAVKVVIVQEGPPRLIGLKNARTKLQKAVDNAKVGKGVTFYVKKT